MAQRFTVHPTHPQPRLIRQAAELVRAGGVIAYPTDSSYALGCGIASADAIKRIRRIREVDDRHPLTLVVHDLAELGQFARLDNRQFRIVRQGVPGPFTFLLAASRSVPRRLQEQNRSTIGFRVPSHPVAEALLAELGAPLLSSTLVLPGDREPMNDPEVIRERLERSLDAIVDAGPCSGEPTTIVDLSVDPPQLVRQGRGDLARLGLGGA